jgi:photosystem II stability/assembly factor-like uncharacterized protein
MNMILAIFATSSILFPASVGAPSGHPAGPDFVSPNRIHGQWRSSIIGGGGYLLQLVETSDPKRMYVACDVGGIFRTDDAGLSWRMIHGTIPVAQGSPTCVRGLEVDPRNPDRILAAVGNQYLPGDGLFLTVNGGRTWRKVASGSFMGNGPSRASGTVIARHPVRTSRIFSVTAGDGVLRSDDGGVTWRNMGLRNYYFVHVQLDRTNPNLVFASATEFPKNAWEYGWDKGRILNPGFFRSTNGGESWTKLNLPPPSEMVQDPVNANRFLGVLDFVEFASITATGNQWVRVQQGLAINPEVGRQSWTSAFSYRALTAGPDFMLTAASNFMPDFYTLRANGRVWTRIRPRLYRQTFEGGRPYRLGELIHVRDGVGWNGIGASLSAVHVSRHNPRRWFFLDWYGLWESTDLGQTWTLRIDGIETTCLVALNQDPNDPGIAHLSMGDIGYFRSTDGGHAFAGDNRLKNASKIVVPAPVLPSRVYAVAVADAARQYEANQVYVSIDRGSTFTPSPRIGLPNQLEHNINVLVVAPDDPYRVWIGVAGEVAPGKGGVYESRDGGRSWTQDPSFPQAPEFFPGNYWHTGPNLAIGPDGSLMAVSHETGAAWLKRLGSESWQRITLPSGSVMPNGVHADPRRAGRFYVITDSIQRTDDFGANWRVLYRDKPPVLASMGYRFALDLANPERMAAGMSEPVLSTDGGATWRSVKDKLPNWDSMIVAFAGDRLLAGTTGNGVFWMPLSPSGDQPVQARPDTFAVPPGSYRPRVPALVNGTMDSGGATPTGWNLWNGAGTASVHRDTREFHRGPAGLRLQLDGYGSVSQRLQSVGTPFTLQAWVKAMPGLEEAQLALRVEDASGAQIGWIQLADLRSTQDWMSVRQVVTLPAAAASVSLTLIGRGKGAIYLDEVSLHRASQPFPVSGGPQS